MLRLSSVNSITPTDESEAAALDTMGDELDHLALTVIALAQASRTLAAALRARGSGQCVGPRMAFVMATVGFTASWRASQRAIAAARDATKAGMSDD